MRRHPELSLKTPESASLQRAVGFNKSQVDRIFYKLEEMQRKYSLPHGRVFNEEERVFSVHESVLKVLSLKGNK
jgi:hypothetical protein